MAGLSMGGMQSFTTVLANMDKFRLPRRIQRQQRRARRLRSEDFEQTACLRMRRRFNKKVKVLFPWHWLRRRTGDEDFSEALNTAGVHNVYFESPGTAHEWLTWRRCLKRLCAQALQMILVVSGCNWNPFA